MNEQEAARVAEEGRAWAQEVCSGEGWSLSLAASALNPKTRHAQGVIALAFCCQAHAVAFLRGLTAGLSTPLPQPGPGEVGRTEFAPPVRH